MRIGQQTFLVQEPGTFPTPQQQKGFDWNKAFTDVTSAFTNFFTARTPQPQGQPTGGGSYTAPGGPTGMSSTTKALLIGGGILVAGILVYSLTKKK